jgi:glutathione S-transferase
LERYRYQLPCLHEGLDPSNPTDYPHLAQWYAAMVEETQQQLPVYACRVKGDASSWRKVLSMAGFGNAGAVPLQIQSNMQDLKLKEEAEARACIDLDVWKEYASTRPYVAATPYREAASILIRNRNAIAQDVCKQAGNVLAWKNSGLPDSLDAANLALKDLASLLMNGVHKNDLEHLLSVSTTSLEELSTLCTFLDDRMCVPRDMGAMTAATIKNLAVALREAS